MLQRWRQHLRQQRWAYAALSVIWLTWTTRLMGGYAPWTPLLVNLTPSLPFTVVLRDYWRRPPFQRGDYLVYRFDGPIQAQFPGMKGQVLFKRVAGVAGDMVSVSGRRVLVNGRDVGLALRSAPRGVRLEPLAPGPIPPGQYYMAGSSADSFDSRYRQSGLVRQDQIIGLVHPLF